MRLPLPGGGTRRGVEWGTGVTLLRRAYLHIGTEKTGTSYIQRFLSENRAVLASKGILYPVVDASENHSTLAWHCADPHQRPSAYYVKAGVAYFDKLEKCIAEADRDAIVILSSEHFHSRCWGKSIGVLNAHLRILKLNVAAVILYLRDQASLAISSYSTAVLCGHTKDFEISDITPQNYYFNYEIACDQWASVFSKDKMNIRPYNSIKSGNIIADFFMAIGISGDRFQNIKDDCIFPSERIHTRLDAPILDIIKNMSLNNISNFDDFVNTIKNVKILSDYSYLDFKDVLFIKTLFDPINRNLCQKFNLDIDLFQSISDHEAIFAHTKGKGRIAPADVLKVTAEIWDHVMALPQTGPTEKTAHSTLTRR